MLQRQPRTFSLQRFLRLVLLIFAPYLVLGAESSSHFEQANRLYEQGKFSEASSLYESMIKAGRHSPPVFFNLGNSYFRSEQLGRALYNFRIAERLAPRDPDIRANLRFTRERVANSVSIAAPAWQSLLQYFTLNELTAVCALLLWVWAGATCITLYDSSLKRKLGGVRLIAGISLGIMFLLLAVSYLLSREQIAIVVTREATIHLGPLAESQPSFSATDGTELDLLAERQDWLQVRDRSNRTGWVAATNVVIFPGDYPFATPMPRATNNLP